MADAGKGPKAGAKPAEGSSKVSPTSGKSAATDSASVPSSEASPGTEPASPESASSAPEGGYYSIKRLRDWARKNPEAAVEFGEQVLWAGKSAPEQTQEWIRIQNKIRKRSDGLDAREQELVEREKLIDTGFNEQVKVLQPITDLFEAAHGKQVEGKETDWKLVDFDAGDAAFHELMGFSIDDYMRHRARKGVPLSASERATRLENERLKKELAEAKPAEPEKKPKAEPEAETVPPKLQKLWETEVDESHPVRQFGNWKLLLTKKMAPYYDADTDEYSADPEAMADKIVKAKLAELAPEPEEEPAPRVKRPVAREPDRKAPPALHSWQEPERPRGKARGDGENTESEMRAVMRPRKVPPPHPEMPKNMDERTRWAVQRAQARARGEQVE